MLLNDDCADCPVEPVLPAENALTRPKKNEVVSSNALIIDVAVVLECSMAARIGDSAMGSLQLPSIPLCAIVDCRSTSINA